MKKMLVLLVVLLMVGCEAKDAEKPKQIIEKAVKQEQQIDKPKEEVKEKPKEEAKQVEEGIIEQEKEGIIEPEEEYNEEDDEDWIREYGNTDEVDDYSEENEYN